MSQPLEKLYKKKRGRLKIIFLKIITFGNSKDDKEEMFKNEALSDSTRTKSRERILFNAVYAGEV